MRQTYTVEADGPRGQWRLRLLPRDPRLAGSLQRIDLYGHEAELRCVENHPAKGPPQRTLMGEAAVAAAQELAGDRIVEVAAGDVGGQVLAAGFVDEVRMDVVPAVFGSGKRFFGSVDTRHLLGDPDVVIQGSRVLHLRFPVRR